MQMAHSGGAVLRNASPDEIVTQRASKNAPAYTSHDVMESAAGAADQRNSDDGTPPQTYTQPTLSALPYPC